LEEWVMTDIVVNIIHVSDEGLLKVAWFQGKQTPGGGAYHVGYSRIVERSKAVRDALQDLVDAGAAKRYTEYNDLVRKLAAAGFRLYEALFFGVTELDRTTAKRARDWLERNLRPLDDNITFRLPSRIHFPWGLIYDQAVTRDTDPSKFKENFWCQKFS